MKIEKAEFGLKSTQLSKERFLSKRSNSMKCSYQHFAFVPTIHPKIKDRITSPLHLIKTVINEDKEGGYSDGEERDNQLFCKILPSRLQKNSIDDDDKREVKSSVELPKINFNTLNFLLSHQNRTPAPMKKSSDTITSCQKTIPDNLQMGSVSSSKKRNSILNSLEKKRKLSSNC